MGNPQAIALSASLEDYLEAIYAIVEVKQAVRAKDIGRRLNVSRSSVTGALHSLAERGLINYAPYDVITLTDKGRKVAVEVVRRHEVLQGFFTRVLSVEAKEADDAACKLEHAIPEGILERFIQFVDFVDRCPRGGAKWIRGFGYFCDHGQELGNCETCVGLVLGEVRSKSVSDTERQKLAATLTSLKRGGKASILSIAGSGGIRRRLLDMGVTAGTVVEVERVAPLGDPIEIKVKGYHLTLRKEEADRISVAPL